MTAGLRINEIHEHKDSSDFVFPPAQLSTGNVGKDNVRPTETVGVSYRAYVDGKDEFTVYADYRNASSRQPLIWPDYTPDLLSPGQRKAMRSASKGLRAGNRPINGNVPSELQ